MGSGLVISAGQDTLSNNRTYAGETFRQDVGRINIMPRTTEVASGEPTPQQWDRIRLTCIASISLSSRRNICEKADAGIESVDGVVLFIAASTLRRDVCMRRRACRSDLHTLEILRLRLQHPSSVKRATHPRSIIWIYVMKIEYRVKW